MLELILNIFLFCLSDNNSEWLCKWHVWWTFRPWQAESPFHGCVTCKFVSLKMKQINGQLNNCVHLCYMLFVVIMLLYIFCMVSLYKLYVLVFFLIIILVCSCCFVLIVLFYFLCFNCNFTGDMYELYSWSQMFFVAWLWATCQFHQTKQTNSWLTCFVWFCFFCCFLSGWSWFVCTHCWGWRFFV